MLAFLAPSAVVIILGVNRGAQFADQEEFHLPTIRQFAAQWPHVDLETYPAAMTPGYHLLMTGLLRAGVGVTGMRVATALVTAALLATLAWAVSRRVSAVDALLLCLPVAWSQYVFAAGVYVVPHNLAWWGVLGILLLALRPRVTAGSYAAFAALLAGLVLVRQIHLWALAPMAVAAWWCGASADDAADRPARADLGGPPLAKPRLGRVLLVLACAVPSVLILAWFFKTWGGLVPRTEAWVRPVRGVNWAAVAMILATFGFLGPFFGGWLDPRGWRWGTAGAGVATLVALVPPTTYDKDAGRWSGLWNLVGRFPIVADRSILIVLFAGVGGFVLAAMLANARPRDRWVLAAAVAGFVAALATINQAWQRYYEPFVLMFCVLAATASAGRTARPAWQVWATRGMAAGLAVLQVKLTVMGLS